MNTKSSNKNKTSKQKTLKPESNKNKLKYGKEYKITHPDIGTVVTRLNFISDDVLEIKDGRNYITLRKDRCIIRKLTRNEQELLLAA